MPNRVIHPAKNVSATVRLPGDKSISHRYAMLGAIAQGVTRLENYSTGADCAACMSSAVGTVSGGTSAHPPA